MAFRIKASDPFPGEFRRVAREQLLKAIHVLAEQPDGAHAAVHAARKRFKRLRALYRLIEPDAKAFRQAENARIRDMARSLSAVRDATALVETVDYLAGLAASAEEFAALGAASRALVERRDRIASSEMDLPRKIEAAIATCHAAIAALDTLDLPEGNGRTAKRIARAWRRQGLKARRALAACREMPAAEAFHDLRKCGQVAWMHLTLLEDLWPASLQARRREMKHLVDELGHEHDLSVLTEAVNESPDLFGDSDTLALLLGAIITRQQAVRADALALAENVFAGDAEWEAEIVRLLWQKAARRLDA
ncbi:CHAD domain-containing protein [Rhizobium sp. CSW-27]|uniref:CHAD domain-containing protein n=1 Tax=Rhizobium sp. CSW-27 TaxID=2839985 RepID=UPI001C03153E|nr:CHAD domain-containing protein [Rhizobium sp. CSW-27]MBT9369223.1 CHAD domain-containing protein [Rhizobium sp. CSW-27]